MLKIYGSDLSVFSNKVRFVANILGIEYDYVYINFREGQHRKAEYLQLHPAGKVPVIDDVGFILFESNAIIKYLAEKKGSFLYPRDLHLRAVIDQWMDFSSMHVGSGVNKVVFNRIFAKRIPVSVDERAIKEGMLFLNRFLPVIEAQYEKHPFLAGEAVTLADINLVAILDPCEIAGIDLLKYPKITQWRNALRQKEFYTQCFKEYGEKLKTV